MKTDMRIQCKTNGRNAEEKNGRPIAAFLICLGLSRAGDPSWGLGQKTFLWDLGDLFALLRRSVRTAGSRLQNGSFGKRSSFGIDCLQPYSAAPARNSFILAKKLSESGLLPAGASASKARSNSFCFLVRRTGVSTRISTNR